MSHYVCFINIIVRTLQIGLNIAYISCVRSISSPTYTNHRHK
uniref:Uncharacterized protein n=1 Tax=virus sp. ctML55 TaxID=2827627 RepID=A0A8S5RIE3_9VIRU|nr:MAG TPA: hypothetical protein [virus sp. ctML55]